MLTDKLSRPIHRFTRLVRSLLKKNVALRLSLSLCLGLCLASGCSHLPGRSFPLLSANSEQQSHLAQQQWQLSYRDRQYSFQVIVERSVNHWQWIMLDNLGQRLATASVKDGIVSIERHQSHFGKELLPELVEALQFSYWPLPDLQQAKAPGWRFQASADQRDIYFSDILRAVVKYQPSAGQKPNPWQGNLSYDNRKSNFQLRIESQVLN